jgi:nucleoside-diphosphate-sugar epimerase
MTRGRKIAILGATGHIAMSLSGQFLRGGLHDLLLFARAPERASAFLASIGFPDAAPCLPFAAFPGCACDVVLNCVGIGDPGVLREAGAGIFRLTETFDTLALDYLVAHPETRYINLSSGAAYGGSFHEPATLETPAVFPANAIGPSDWYGIAKLHAEARHRALSPLPIADLRIFSYFSRHIPLDARFLMSEAVASILSGKTFETGPDDIVRDYIHPADLFALVESCLDAEPFNDVLDVRSLAPARKSEILEMLAARFGLRHVVSGRPATPSATGCKPAYFSTSDRAASLLGFSPRFTSLECLAGETAAILYNQGRPSPNGAPS